MIFLSLFDSLDFGYTEVRQQQRELRIVIPLMFDAFRLPLLIILMVHIPYRILPLSL